MVIDLVSYVLQTDSRIIGGWGWEGLGSGSAPLVQAEGPTRRPGALVLRVRLTLNT